MTTERYDVALSFAGEDRDLASVLAHALRQRSISVFFDEFEKMAIWGKDLYEFLSDIYFSRADLCVVFISEAYAKKIWTKLELQSAQSRAIAEDREYILPLQIDGTEVPTILRNVGCIDLRETPLEQVADFISRKVAEYRGGNKRDTIRSRRGRDYFRSVGATVPGEPVCMKEENIEVAFAFANGNVSKVVYRGDEKDIWLYESEDNAVRAVFLKDSVLQVRRGQYISAMYLGTGLGLEDGIVVAAMNYSSQQLVWSSDAIRYIAVASIYGIDKVWRTLRKGGKPSVAKAFCIASFVFALSALLSDSIAVSVALLCLSFVLVLAYQYILALVITLEIEEGEERIRAFIMKTFGAVQAEPGIKAVVMEAYNGRSSG